MADWYDSNGIPPWETGRHQPAYENWVDNNDIMGKVADIGCGTGENTLFLAEQGYEVMGYDLSKIAIKKAKRKAEERESSATFQQMDIRELVTERREFDTIVESGLIHNFETDTKRELVKVVQECLVPGGTYLILGIHEDEPMNRGPPNRLYLDEISDLFSEQQGWRLEYVKETEFDSRYPDPLKARMVKAVKIDR